MHLLDEHGIHVSERIVKDLLKYESTAAPLRCRLARLPAPHTSTMLPLRTHSLFSHVTMAPLLLMCDALTM